LNKNEGKKDIKWEKRIDKDSKSNLKMDQKWAGINREEMAGPGGINGTSIKETEKSNASKNMHTNYRPNTR